MGTPLTHARYLRRHRGSYGPAIRAGEALFPWPATPLPGLYCASDSTFPGGWVPVGVGTGGGGWLAITRSEVPRTGPLAALLHADTCRAATLRRLFPHPATGAAHPRRHRPAGGGRQRRHHRKLDSQHRAAPGAAGGAWVVRGPYAGAVHLRLTAGRVRHAAQRGAARRGKGRRYRHSQVLGGKLVCTTQVCFLRCRLLRTYYAVACRHAAAAVPWQQRAPGQLAWQCTAAARRCGTARSRCPSSMREHCVTPAVAPRLAYCDQARMVCNTAQLHSRLCSPVPASHVSNEAVCDTLNTLR